MLTCVPVYYRLYTWYKQLLLKGFKLNPFFSILNSTHFKSLYIYFFNIMYVLNIDLRFQENVCNFLHDMYDFIKIYNNYFL